MSTPMPLDEGLPRYKRLICGMIDGSQRHPHPQDTTGPSSGHTRSAGEELGPRPLYGEDRTPRASLGAQSFLESFEESCQQTQDSSQLAWVPSLESQSFFSVPQDESSLSDFYALVHAESRNQIAESFICLGDGTSSDSMWKPYDHDYQDADCWQATAPIPDLAPGTNFSQHFLQEQEPTFRIDSNIVLDSQAPGYIQSSMDLVDDYNTTTAVAYADKSGFDRANELDVGLRPNSDACTTLTKMTRHVVTVDCSGQKALDSARLLCYTSGSKSSDNAQAIPSLNDGRNVGHSRSHTRRQRGKARNRKSCDECRRLHMKCSRDQKSNSASCDRCLKLRFECSITP